MRSRLAPQLALPGVVRPGRGSGPVCKICRQPIRFLRLDTGQEIPVDRQPSRLNGTVRIKKGVARILSTIDSRVARERGVPLFVPHWKTCVEEGRYLGRIRAA